MSDDIAAETERVREQLKTTHARRTAAQRTAAEGATVTMALQRTARDRSALSSPDVDTERGRVQDLHDELVDLYDRTDYLRSLLAKVKATSRPVDTQTMEELLAAEAASRADRAARLEQNGTRRG